MSWNNNTTKRRRIHKNQNINVIHPHRMLDIPNIIDSNSSSNNIICWSNDNIIAIGLYNDVYLYNYITKNTIQFISL